MKNMQSEIVNKFLMYEDGFLSSNDVLIDYCLVRFSLFRFVQNRQDRHSNLKHKIFYKALIIEFVATFIFLIRVPFFLLSKRRSSIFFSGGGIEVENKKLRSTLTKSIVNRKLKNNEICIELIHIHKWNHIKFLNEKNHIFIPYYFYFFLVFVLGFFFKFYKRNSLKKSSIVIDKYFNINNDKYVFNRILISRVKAVICKLMFKMFSPSEVLVVDGYSSNIACFLGSGYANKEIKTIELQHGIISKMHFGYNSNLAKFPKLCLPNCMYLWGIEWISYNRFVKEGGVAYKIEKNISPLRSNPNCKIKTNAILFIGQPSVQREMLHLYNKISKKYKGVYYRPHPRENLKNIPSYVLISDEVNLHKSLCHYKIIIGGFSTALIEARMFKCRVFSFNPIVPDGYSEVLLEFGVEIMKDETMLSECIDNLLKKGV
jgi:hypothetical protein